MNPKIKNNVTDFEYFRLPQMHIEDTFQEMQKVATEKLAQSMLGAFPESENQMPYLDDGDYPTNEYLYPPWEMPPYAPLEFPDELIPKEKFCQDLWKKLFGDWAGGAVNMADPSMMQRMHTLSEAGCLQYMPRNCCSEGVALYTSGWTLTPNRAGTQKIDGPTTLLPGQRADYSINPGVVGCSYEYKATSGSFVGNTYCPPDGAGVGSPFVDTISVTPWMSDDAGNICATLAVTIDLQQTCGDVSIQATQITMLVDTEQTLYVANAVPGVGYQFVLEGSGALSGGSWNSIVYESPSENENCQHNANIFLKVNGVTCDRITINITKGSSLEAGVTCCTWIWTQQDPPMSIYYHCTNTFNCSGDWIYNAGGSCQTYCSSLGVGYNGYNSCAQIGMPSITDIRTDAMKLNGCCPPQLA